MEQEEKRDLNGWVDFLGRAEIPVLKSTIRDLTVLRANPDKVSAGAVADLIARDPLMTVRLLRYLQQHKHSKQQRELVQVEQVLLMMGVESFFNKVMPQVLVEDMLRPHLQALVNVLQVINRSHRASGYAMQWAGKRYDMHFEEVRIAALLHDIAEILMWCFAPQSMLRIRELQVRDKHMRSRSAQEEVLGFALMDLQRVLAKEWALPELLLTLTDAEFANQPRVRNVLLAVNLARHSANGWDDAALPDDYAGIAELLNITPEQVMVMIEAEAGIACDISKPHA
ncbi:MAG: HDOD domain-containing protein [Pseudomonadota bacterium]